MSLMDRTAADEAHDHEAVVDLFQEIIDKFRN